MSTTEANQPVVPSGSLRLKGSERHIGPRSKRLGPADPAQIVDITLVLRRRSDGAPVPDAVYWAETHPLDRTYLSVDELAERTGAVDGEIHQVAAFATAHGLELLESSVARRMVRARGTVARLDVAFGIALQHYETSPVARRPSRKLAPRRDPDAQAQFHHSYEGHLHLPESIAPYVVAVFGLNNYRVGAKNIDPDPTTLVTVPQVCQLYGWPTGDVTGQTIGLIAGPLTESDVKLYFENLNKSLYVAGYYVAGAQPAAVPLVTPPAGAVIGHYNVPKLVSVGSNSGVSDGECNLDVSIVGSVAPGATVALYFNDLTSNGFFTAFTNAIKPVGDQPIPSVLSCSYALLPAGDDSFNGAMVTPMEVVALSQLIEDAPSRGLTICVASGDEGVGDGVEVDNQCYVQYLASDPGVLACGATTIGAIQGTQFEEFLWDDIYDPEFANFGATGGGISAFFNSTNTAYPECRQPSYQSGTAIPPSKNDGSIGRGVPDVAANGGSSGYYVYTNGFISGETGTSAATPLIAGLILQLNALVGTPVGWLNPLLYATAGALCRKVTSSPAANAIGNSILIFGFDDVVSVVQQGYVGTTTGWDACTGWGVLDFAALVKQFGPAPKKFIPDHKLIREWFPPFGEGGAGNRGGSGWPWKIPPGVFGQPLENAGLAQGNEDGNAGARVFIREEERPSLEDDFEEPSGSLPGA